MPASRFKDNTAIRRPSSLRRRSLNDIRRWRLHPTSLFRPLDFPSLISVPSPSALTVLSSQGNGRRLILKNPVSQALMEIQLFKFADRGIADLANELGSTDSIIGDRQPWAGVKSTRLVGLSSGSSSASGGAAFDKIATSRGTSRYTHRFHRRLRCQATLRGW